MSLSIVAASRADARRCHAPSPEAQAVGEHRHARERHRRRGDHRVEQPAGERVEHAGGDRDAEHVVEERPEQVLRESRAACRARARMASTTPWRSVRISVMSAASIAMSVPDPIAMPTSACASAGASLMPSPTIATTRPCAWSAFTSSALCPGSTPGAHAARSRRAARPRARIASAVAGVSPVSITMSSPSARMRGMASRASGRGVSARPSSPRTRPPPVASARAPPRTSPCARRDASRRRLRPRRAASRTSAASCRRRALPTIRRPAVDVRLDAVAGPRLERAGLDERQPLRVGGAHDGGRERMFGAALGRRGERSSSAASSLAPSASRSGTTSVTSGRPVVIVPVLSSTTVVDRVRALEHIAALDEDAALGAPSRPDEDGRGRRQAHRARARDDEHRDEVDERRRARARPAAAGRTRRRRWQSR